MSIEQKMAELALSFPSIRGLIEQEVLQGIDPWSITVLRRNLEEMPFELGRGVTQAIKFVLWVWHGGNDFNLYVAWSYWDEEHRAAWLDWAKEPWWA